MENFIAVKTMMRRRRVLKTAYNYIVSDNGEKIKVPAIRFSGKYLGDLGFTVGSKFEFLVNEDRSITLRPIQEESVSSNGGQTES